MRKRIQRHIESKVEILTSVENKQYVIIAVGLGTVFFGFLEGKMYNLYLIWIDSPFVNEFRAALTYKSAIFGDGILLPVVNMVIASFFFNKAKLITRKTIQLGLFFGALVTAYFHIAQAVGNVVNWAMPKPWEWNMLGLWHAIYMYTVASFMSLFFIIVIKTIKKEKYVPKELIIVTMGIIIFFILLRLDYIDINLKTVLPSF